MSRPPSNARTKTNQRPPTMRGVTLKQIAAAMGLSQPAVSQALNGTGRLSKETRRRILETAVWMGYRPNAAARAVVTRRSRQVGVLVLNNPDDPKTFPYTYYIILGMNMALELEDYVLCLVRMGDVEQSLGGPSRVFREHVLDGVIVSTGLPDHVSARIEELVPACVWADSNRWARTRCVRRDELEVGRLAAEAAVKAGYKRILFLTEELNANVVPHYSHADRGKGIEAVCSDAGVEFRTMRQRWIWKREFSDRLRAALAPDVAVICTDTFRARLVQQTAAVNRLMIGEDFGLACCDLTPDISLTWPDLAGLPFDRMELGKRSAEMLLSILEGGNQTPKSISIQSTWSPGATLPDRQ